jgi:type II secretory pathway pseudopilin PulG
MNPLVMHHRQRGMTLVLGLIMLALITLTVTTAFTLSNTNLKSVSNMQFRNEAIAAANEAIEQVISSPFALTPAASQFNVDINNDGTFDYVVDVTIPACTSASIMGAGAQTGIQTSVEIAGFETPPPVYDTLWDIQATVTDPKSGTSVVVHHGIRRRQLDQATRLANCPGTV